MKQVKIGLTGRQRGALERSAKEAGRSLSEEIRRRLAMSLSDDERFSVFAQLMGEQMKWLSQMVVASALDGGQGLVITHEQWKKIAPTVQRALVVALNEWFVIIFGVPPAANPEADTIGKTAAKNYSLLASELDRREAEEKEKEEEEAEGET